MDKPTLIRARTGGTGTLWVEEAKLLATDQVIARFPTTAPETALERTALILAIASRRKRKYRERGTTTELAGPSVYSAEVAQHLQVRKP